MEAPLLSERLASPVPLVPVQRATVSPLGDRLNESPRVHSLAQLRASLNGPKEEARTVRRGPNRTGLPDGLKAGVEALSGVSMDDVRVHRNSSRPAQLSALAYARGTEIHLGPGQERHLPHEAWHVAQQKQGRVRATTQAKGVPVNDQAELEQEADVMGEKALRIAVPKEFLAAKGAPDHSPVQRVGLKDLAMNVGSASYNYVLSTLRSGTPLATLRDFLRDPKSQTAQDDLLSPSRWRLNPGNIVAGMANAWRESEKETLNGKRRGNYHSSSRHGAHNTLGNAMARLNNPSTMQDHYALRGTVKGSTQQGRFNSEMWEDYSWRKARDLFTKDMEAEGIGVTWVPGPILGGGTWNVALDMGTPVGLSHGTGAPSPSEVERVKVAINYTHLSPGSKRVKACNGQMFPIPATTVVRAGTKGGSLYGPGVGSHNGKLINVPYQRLGVFGL